MEAELVISSRYKSMTYYEQSSFLVETIHNSEPREYWITMRQTIEVWLDDNKAVFGVPELYIDDDKKHSYNEIKSKTFTPICGHGLNKLGVQGMSTVLQRFTKATIARVGKHMKEW